MIEKPRRQCIGASRRQWILNGNASFAVLMQVKLATSLTLPREIARLDITITTMINEELQ